MSKHTPGPWVADKIVDRNAYNIFAHGATHALLTVSAPAHDGAPQYAQQAEANARLIAAAPDLLEALKALRLAREQDKYRSWEKGVPKFKEAEALADAAIVKATGSAQ